MLSLGSLRLPQNLARINLLLNQASPIILTITISLVIFHSYLLIQQSNGGSDLVSADIPKSLMLLQGQNPYSVQPWASPYPPLLLLTVSGIIRLTSLLASQPSLDLISQHIRTTGLIANSAVALTIYLYIRSKTGKGHQALIPASLFLTLPATSISPLYYFHSDTFGYPLLALSLVALAQHRYLTGTTLLATAAIFKIHPILALPLVIIWLIRTRGLRHTLPSLASTTTLLTLGLILPLEIPGYQQAVLGFNLSNTGNGTTMSTMMSLLNRILPQPLQVNPTQLLTNQAWLATTLALYTIILGIVWKRARSLGPIDIVLLGLLAWLIPLRIEYTHYAVWAIIPFLMRGQLKQTILITGLLQLADTTAYWSWWPNTSPIPGMNTFYGLILNSAIYRLLGLTALAMTLKRTGSVIQSSKALTVLVACCSSLSPKADLPPSLVFPSQNCSEEVSVQALQESAPFCPRSLRLVFFQFFLRPERILSSSSSLIFQLPKESLSQPRSLDSRFITSEKLSLPFFSRARCS